LRRSVHLQHHKFSGTMKSTSSFLPKFGRSLCLLVSAFSFPAATFASRIIIPTSPPPATWSGVLSGADGGVGYSDLDISSPGAFSSAAGGASSGFSGLGGFSASLTATATAVGGPGTVMASAFDEFIYSFEIFGPTPTVDILVSADGSAYTSPLAGGGFTSGNSAGSDIEIYPAGGAFVLVGAVETGSTTGLTDEGFSTTAGEYGADEGEYNGAVDDGVFAAETDTVYTVILEVGADVSMIDGIGSTTATATVDPIIQFAPGVVDPGSYTFEYSPGIGVGAAVPEAGSALGLLALSLIGLNVVRGRLKGPAPGTAESFGRSPLPAPIRFPPAVRR
jgi:hypothetical protein